jgi:hypothetical protein
MESSQLGMEDDRKHWGDEGDWNCHIWKYTAHELSCMELLQTEGSENSCMEGEWSCHERLLELPKMEGVEIYVIYGRRMELPLTEGLEKSCREDAWNCHRRKDWRSHVWKANEAATNGRTIMYERLLVLPKIEGVEI